MLVEEEELFGFALLNMRTPLLNQDGLLFLVPVQGFDEE